MTVYPERRTVRQRISRARPVLIGLLTAAPAVAAAQAGDIDPGQAILDRYVEAIGGRAAIERIRTRVTKATMSVGWGMNAEIETIQQSPDRFVSRASVKMFGKPVAEFSSGYDGQVGWSQEKDGLRTLSGTELQQLVLGSRLDREARLDELYPKRKAVPDVTIGGKQQHVVEMSTTFGTQELWFFDAASGLLTRTEAVQDRAKKGRVKVATTFHDYREVDGVRVPFRVVTQEGKDSHTMKIKSLRHNADVDPDIFAPPR